MDSASFRLNTIRVLLRTPHATAAHFPHAPPLASLATGVTPRSWLSTVPAHAHAPPFAAADVYVEDREEDAQTSAEGSVEDALLGDRVLREDKQLAGGPGSRRRIIAVLRCSSCCVSVCAIQPHIQADGNLLGLRYDSKRSGTLDCTHRSRIWRSPITLGSSASRRARYLSCSPPPGSYTRNSASLHYAATPTRSN
jgi:hypothetical protein